MQHDYRGHFIRLIHAERWIAELIELDTGALLPTSVTATASEGLEICAERARALIDRYLEAPADRDRRQAARPARSSG